MKSLPFKFILLTVLVLVGSFNISPKTAWAVPAGNLCGGECLGSYDGYGGTPYVSPVDCDAGLTCANLTLMDYCGGVQYEQGVCQPIAFVSVGITASPISVPYGGQTILSWSSANASSCTATGPWSNSGTLNGSGWTNPLYTNTTFTFQCTGFFADTATQSVTVVVAPPAPTATLSASPISVVNGGQVALSWSSTNASACYAGGPWSNGGTLNGSGWTGPLYANTTFTFQCSGPGGTTPLQSVSVAVAAPLSNVTSLSVSPNPVPYGSTATLSYSCSNGLYSHLILDGSWAWQDTGYFTSRASIIPAQTVPGAHSAWAYCYNADWVASANSWFIVPYTVSPPIVNGGWSAWSAPDPTCGITGTQTRTCTNPAPSGGGAACVGPATQTYTNPACPANVTSLSVSPNPVPYGSTANLSYTCSNGLYTHLLLDGVWDWNDTGYFTSRISTIPAQTVPGAHSAWAYCYNSAWVPSANSWFIVPYTVSPQIVNGGWSAWSAPDPTCGITGTQTRTCTNPAPSGGGAACVGPATQTYTNVACPATATLSAAPTTVAYGSRATLTWGSTGATSCTAGGPWSNAGTLSGSGLTGALYSNSTFTFQCSGPGGLSPVQSVTVTVGAPQLLQQYLYHPHRLHTVDKQQSRGAQQMQAAVLRMDHGTTQGH